MTVKELLALLDASIKLGHLSLGADVLVSDNHGAAGVEWASPTSPFTFTIVRVTPGKES